MFEPQGTKLMFDLHGLSVKEVKKLLKDCFEQIEEQNIGEIYLITGRGNHVNTDGTRGVLKKILPKLLKPYCQDIIQINQETGAYKIIFKPRQELSELKAIFTKLFSSEKEQINYAKTLQQKADKEDVEAILALATIHLHQAIKGFDDINKGIALLLKAKQLGSLEASVHLGIHYHEGLIVKQQHEKAFKYFSYAANKEDPVAQYYLAICYFQGKGTKHNDEQAINWMKKSADQGEARAQFNLGCLYIQGEFIQENIELGIYYKMKAAEQGIAEAQIDIAKCYATGYGVKQDYPTAFKWYLAASKSNKAYALYQVGSYLLDGRSGLPNNEVAAFPWFLKAAELGDADGQAQLASQYLFGSLAVEQDIEKGLAWAKKSIAQNNEYGYYVMACAHREGVGVEQDNIKSDNFLELSAQSGCSQAQYELGIRIINREALHIAQDCDTGIKWLREAAIQNHAEARQALDELFMQIKSAHSYHSPHFFKPVPVDDTNQEQPKQLGLDEHSSSWCVIS